MRLTVAYSKIKKRNLVLINNDTHQRETVSERPIRPPLILRVSCTGQSSKLKHKQQMNHPYARVNQLYATLTRAIALCEGFGVQLHKNNGHELLSRIQYFNIYFTASHMSEFFHFTLKSSLRNLSLL